MLPPQLILRSSSTIQRERERGTWQLSIATNLGPLSKIKQEDEEVTYRAEELERRLALARSGATYMIIYGDITPPPSRARQHGVIGGSTTGPQDDGHD